MSQPSTFARSDTLLGVCEALGEDLGFNPLWLRIALAIGLLWNPVAIVGGYLALGAAVAAARWLTPVRAAATVAATPPVGENDDAPAPIQLAA